MVWIKDCVPLTTANNCGWLKCSKVVLFCRTGSKFGVTTPTCCMVAPPVLAPLDPPPLLERPAAYMLPFTPRPLSTLAT